MGHVRSDEGVTKRISNCTPVPLGYHADNSDIVLLACRTQAASGGALKIPAVCSLGNKDFCVLLDVSWVCDLPPVYLHVCVHGKMCSCYCQTLVGIGCPFFQPKRLP